MFYQPRLARMVRISFEYFGGECKVSRAKGFQFVSRLIWMKAKRHKHFTSGASSEIPLRILPYQHCRRPPRESKCPWTFNPPVSATRGVFKSEREREIVDNPFNLTKIFRPSEWEESHLTQRTLERFPWNFYILMNSKFQPESILIKAPSKCVIVRGNTEWTSPSAKGFSVVSLIQDLPWKLFCEREPHSLTVFLTQRWGLFPILKSRKRLSVAPLFRTQHREGFEYLADLTVNELTWRCLHT